MTKAATVFISYLSHAANDVTLKKTIGADDVMTAIYETGFDAFRPRLEAELEAYSTVIAGKRKGYRMKVKERESLGGKGADGAGEVAEEEGEGGRVAKRPRMDVSGDASFESGLTDLVTSVPGEDGGPSDGIYDGAAEASEGDTLEDDAALEAELEEADAEVGDDTQDEEEDGAEEDEEQDDPDDAYDGPGAQLRAGIAEADDDTEEESD
jgi:hypothetical protein